MIQTQSLEVRWAQSHQSRHEYSRLELSGSSIDHTVRRLKAIVRKQLPEILSLLETKQFDDYIRDLVQELGYDHVVTVPPSGMNGGITVIWKKYVSVSVDFQSPNLVDCYVNMIEESSYLSFVYGHPDPSFRNNL